MKRFFLSICLLLSLSTFAQKDTMQPLVVPTVPNTDSFMQQQLEKMDSINTARSIESMNNNMVSFMQQQNERSKKQKQQMWMRLGFAAILIVIGIVGFTRKKKQKTQV